jgi:hypothetical protein
MCVRGWSFEASLSDGTSERSGDRVKSLIKHRGMRWAVLPASACLAHVPAASAQERPDFSGVWRNYQGPSIGGGQPAAWPEDAPYTSEARRKLDEYQALVEGTGSTPGGFCVGTGMPGSMLGSTPVSSSAIGSAV